jgi:hypothetical protein
MRMLPKSIVTWVELGLIAVVVSACATAANPLTRTTEFDTLVPGWESKFSIAFKSEPAKDGTSLVYGRIASHYGQHASPFRVLGMALDSSGKVIGQRVEWVPGGVPGFTDVYFEIDHLALAASYKVTVWDYTFIEARGGTMQ